MPLLLPRPKLLAPTRVSLASPPARLLPNTPEHGDAVGSVLLHCQNAEPAADSATKAWSSLPSCRPGSSFVMLKCCGVLSWQGSAPEEGTSRGSSASQQLERRSWTQLCSSSPQKLNIFLLVNMALPSPSLPSSQVPFWSLSRATHSSPQAGTRAGSSLSAAHTAFLPLGAGTVTPGSILCPLEERGTFPTSPVCGRRTWTPGWH